MNAEPLMLEGVGSPLFVQNKYRAVLQGDRGSRPCIILECTPYLFKGEQRIVIGGPSDEGLVLYGDLNTAEIFRDPIPVSHLFVHPNGRNGALYVAPEHMPHVSQQRSLDRILSHQDFHIGESTHNLQQLFYDDLRRDMREHHERYGRDKNPAEAFFNNFHYYLPGGKYRYDEAFHQENHPLRQVYEQHEIGMQLQRRDLAPFGASQFRRSQTLGTLLHAVDFVLHDLNIDRSALAQFNGQGSRYQCEPFVNVAADCYTHLRMLGYTHEDLTR